MAISASQIATTNTLEQLRTEFNNLRDDVSGLESGTISFSGISTTTLGSTSINVEEDGTIVFEGATDNAFETTLTVVDPTADRTITLPDTSGTVVVSGDGSFTVSNGGTIGSTSATNAMTIASTGIVTFVDDILIKDGGTIGVASTVDAMTVSSSGIVTFKDDILIKDGGTIGSASSTSAITVASTGIVTFVDDILIKDGGTIGVASTVDALTISSAGIVTFKDDVVIKDGGTIGTGTTPAAITIASGGDVTLSGSTTISGDLTISGDDLIMGTNTSSMLLIADGTNFNPTAVGDLTEISTIASDDVLLAIDTSGGGLKRVARSTLVSGLATSSAISNIVEDTSPQLGGNLDVLARTITTSTTNGNIAITPNGSGVVLIDGQVGIEAGIIDLKNSGSTVSKILFYCESSNAHAQTLIGAPHAESASNTLTLPSTGGNSRLLSAASTATLTNKTLTSPVLNTATVGTSIVPASADGATLGTASVEFSDLFLADASTIQFGNDQEIRLTHVADVGLTLTHTGTGDNLPIVLQLKSEEDVIIANEVIGSLEFAAGDSDGTDGATVAAGIHAIAEGTFSASANATKLVFTTGVSETAASSATAKMTLSSAGLLTIADDFLIKDGGTIGVASTVDALTISSAGIVTFKDDILIKDGGTIGVASSTSAMTIASTGIVTFVDDILIKDGGTIGVASTVDAMTVSSAGIVTFKDDILIKDGGTIGVASTADALTISSAGLLTVKDDLVIKSGGTIGGSGDTDLLTLGSAILTVAGEISVTTLDIGGTNVSATAAELNIMDGNATVGTTAVADGDGIVTNDGTTMRQTTVQTFATYFASEITAMSNLVTTGALNSGTITSGFGTINNGSSAITTTGTVNFGSLADGTITVTAFADEDDMSSDSATLVPTQQSVKKYVDDSVATAATTGKAIAMAIVFG